MGLPCLSPEGWLPAHGFLSWLGAQFQCLPWASVSLEIPLDPACVYTVCFALACMCFAAHVRQCLADTSVFCQTKVCVGVLESSALVFLSSCFTVVCTLWGLFSRRKQCDPAMVRGSEMVTLQETQLDPRRTRWARSVGNWKCPFGFRAWPRYKRFPHPPCPCSCKICFLVILQHRQRAVAKME